MRKKILYNLVPKDTFLYNIMKTYEAFSIPNEYSFAAGLFMLGTICGADSYIMYKYKRYYMNLMQFMIGDHSILSKAEIVMQLMSHFGDYFNSLNPNCVFISSMSDPKTVTVRMEQNTAQKLNNNVCMLASEITSPLYKTFDFYQDLYNNPVERSGYYGKHNYVIRNISFNCLLGCTFENYIEKVLQNSTECDWTLGTNILIPITSDFNGVIDSDTDYLTEARKNLAKIYEEGPHTFTADGHIIQSFNTTIRKYRCTDRRFAAFFARRGEITIKLAGLFAINRNSKQISVDDLHNAFKYVELIYKTMQDYVKNSVVGVETDEVSSLVLHIQRILLKQGDNGIKHCELYQRLRFKCDKVLFRNVLNILHELELIDKYIMNKGKAVLYMRNVNTQTLDCSKVIRKLKEL